MDEEFGIVVGFALAHNAPPTVMNAIQRLRKPALFKFVAKKSNTGSADALIEAEAARVEKKRAGDNIIERVITQEMKNAVDDAQPKPVKFRRARKPLSDEYKQELRDRLTRAREKKAKINSNPPIEKTPPKN